jgi:hypothetical protein
MYILPWILQPQVQQQRFGQSFNALDKVKLVIVQTCDKDQQLSFHRRTA